MAKRRKHKDSVVVAKKPTKIEFLCGCVGRPVLGGLDVEIRCCPTHMVKRNDGAWVITDRAWLDHVNAEVLRRCRK